jgi:hypothetical protein
LRERSSLLRAVLVAVAGAATDIRAEEAKSLAREVRNEVIAGLNGAK